MEIKELFKLLRIALQQTKTFCKICIRQVREKLVGQGIECREIMTLITCAESVTEISKLQKSSASVFTIQLMPVLCATRAVVGAGCPVPVTTRDAVGVSLSGRLLLIPSRLVAAVPTYAGLLNA